MDRISTVTLGAWVGLATAALTATADAAQLRLEIEQEQALAQIEAAFPEHQVRILDTATTDRFALIYAQHADGSAVTVTLRQLPQQAGFLDLTIATDSPQNPALERRLMQALTHVQRNDTTD